MFVTGKIKVTDTVLEKLITLVHENPCLYDVRSKEHKDAIKVANIWASIADIMGAEEMTGWCLFHVFVSTSLVILYHRGRNR